MFEVALTAGAASDLRRLDPAVASRVVGRLRWLAENADSIKPERLTGRWRGVLKLRVGAFRVLYTCDIAERRLVVHFVRHRRDVYKVGEKG
ncbi:MAG: type II toxin-antitoxin system RelE/ParE family toxin [Holophagales bacterium]|nr:type II toxin-antitoxin system RelE/ParE family toxin [Holophagales bacterium]MYH23992.1 type II toxin-antitoxin system RelE/ParE family toxin [Holophagales bacterium]